MQSLENCNMTQQQIRNGWLIFDPIFVSFEQQKNWFDTLIKECPWEETEITIFGKTFPVPRQEVFFSQDGKSYGYSGKRLKTHPYFSLLEQIQQQIEKASGLTFNSVLINHYRNGQDSNGWHADNEPELGHNPIIASLSLGATRRFDLRHNLTNEKIQLDLQGGSLLIMGGETQHFWKHQIAKTKKVNAARINLTFRTIR